MRSPCAPPGARRASRERRGTMSAIAYVPSRASRSSSTSSPTTSLSDSPCLSRPRNDTSCSAPDASRARQTPPVPRNTTALTGVPALSRAVLVAHRLPPRPASGRQTLGDQRVEQHAHPLKRHPAYPRTRLVAGARALQEIGLQMAAHPRLTRAPLHEQQVGAHRRIRIARLVRLDRHAVRPTVAPRERRRTRVYRHVAAERPLVALRVIGRKKPT